MIRELVYWYETHNSTYKVSPLLAIDHFYIEQKYNDKHLFDVPVKFYVQLDNEKDFFERFLNTTVSTAGGLCLCFSCFFCNSVHVKDLLSISIAERLFLFEQTNLGF